MYGLFLLPVSMVMDGHRDVAISVPGVKRSTDPMSAACSTVIKPTGLCCSLLYLFFDPSVSCLSYLPMPMHPCFHSLQANDQYPSTWQVCLSPCESYAPSQPHHACLFSRQMMGGINKNM